MVHTLLGTDDPDKQTERIQELMTLATAPVMTLVITVDSRTGRISMTPINADGVPMEVLYEALEEVRRQLIRAERQATASGQKGNHDSRLSSPVLGTVPEEPHT